MKVIAKKDNETYIAEITHTEIEKVVGKFFGKLKRLKPEDEIDLELPYDVVGVMNSLRSDIRALKEDIAEFDVMLESLKLHKEEKHE